MESLVSRRFRKSGLMLTASYFMVFFGSFYLDTRMHPVGGELWALASLPVLPIVGVIVLFGRYLRDERDEYKRELTMRFLLWGTAGCLAVNMFAGFLSIYGWKGRFPPFSGFWAFFVFMLAAKLTYRVKNRVPADE
jgi:hypothetical protein